MRSLGVEFSRSRLRQEDGIALVMALGITVVLIIFVASMITYTTSNQRSTSLSGADLQARTYAEGGLNTAYSIIWNTNLSGADPTAAGLIGTPASPKTVCLSTGQTCSSSGVPGTVSLYGCYGGTNGTTCNGVSVAKSTWLVVSTGYAYGASNGATAAETTMGTIAISPLNSGAVAAVWNHMFLTAPLIPNTCQTTFSGNTLSITAPIYSIGNVCFTGNTDNLIENGQPVDLMVGGKLVFAGNSDSVGTNGHPITSGVVVGGCTTNVTASTTPCTNGTWPYYVANPETFISQDAPTLDNTGVEADYSNSDPGPKHGCLAGTTPAPLNANQFDFTVGGTEGTSSLPDTTGSGSSGGVFNLTPTTSYACISQNGTSAGYLIWNAGGSSLTVSGITVPAKTLAINGFIFFDANLQVTQSATYTGTAVIMTAGTIVYPSTVNNVTLCAVSACGSSWQGTSGNNSMLTLASLAASSAAISLNGNTDKFQGSLYTQPTSGLTLIGNSASIQGPMSIGTVNVVGNTPNFTPLPVIKNMPVGAPVPPNTGVTIGPLSVVH